MAHLVTLVDQQNHLDKDTLQDFIDLFFDARDSNFTIEVVPTYGKVPNPSIRGMCATSNLGNFRITLYAGNIKEHISRGLALGGNVTKARDLKLGLYLVLTHELRHAHQSIYFGANSTLHQGRYKARAGEVDARRHVDENYDAVCAFLGFDPERVQQTLDSLEVAIYLDLLAEAATVDGMVHATDDQVWDQVMTMPGDPDVLHRKVMEGLAARGLRLM